ncbi:MAG TPA: NlpC/P60 family protein [Acidimicrobiales bacterium]|nr:NlpC/P60 family protein [Acidimicrobiales bacterium]
MIRVRRRGTTQSIPLLAVVALIGTLLVPAVAHGASIQQTQAQISALSARLAQQQRESETTANAYDAAKVRLASLQNDIAALTRQEIQKRAEIKLTSKKLQVAAVRAYVYGAADAQIIALFNQSVTTSDARNIYQSQVVGDLASIKSQYESQKKSLDATIHQVAAKKSQAQHQTDTMQALLAQNIRNQNETQATLAVVTQALKTEIIAYEVRAGAAAARSRNVAQEEAAVAAASAVGGQAAANQVLAAIKAATPPTTVYSGTPAGSKQGMAALHWAETQIGVPYVWGGESPGHGFDCSGLVQWAWAKAGFTIPRTTEQQYPAMHHVPLTALQPGDLLFYYNLDGDHLIDHVVMYAGSGPWGTSTIIAAAHSGTTVSLAPIFTFGLVGAARP